MMNKDVRTFFKKESLYAEKITNLLLDNRHHNNIILILDDYYTYLEHMLKNYAKIANVQSFSAFFPVEMVAFYPEIGRNFEKIYEVRKDVIIDISDSIEKKIAEFNKDLSKEKPKIKLFRKDNKVEASFQCNSASTIVAYKKIKNTQYISKEKDNYFEYIRLNPIIKLMESKDVKLVDIEKLSYQEKKWYIEGRAVDDNVSFYVISCLDINGKSTSLSDVLYFLP